jgi:NADH-quinone oxidoreductase subunit N
MNALLAETLPAPSIPWVDLAPLLILLGGASFLLLVGSLVPRWPRGGYVVVTAGSAIAAAIMSMIKWNNLGHDAPESVLYGALNIDRFAIFAWITIAIAIVLVSLLTHDYLVSEDQDGPEVYALYLTTAIGGFVMAASGDLIVLFLGLETLSLSLYVLAASNRRREESQEAGLKYFILGGFSSAFLLYGIALLYGATGTTNLEEMAQVLNDSVSLQRVDGLLLIGIALLLVGLAFKVAAVPFHVWTPDVYQGSPSPVTAFMASAGKVAAFAALLRILVTALERRVDDWRPVIWALAILTMVVGSLLAVVQTNVKRMLAFSSISHAGFLLIGVEAAGHIGDTNGLPATMTYLMLYTVMVIGSFAVITVIANAGDGGTSLEDIRGVAKARPALALAFTIFLLAQAGVPLTSGFIAKFGVIQAAVEVDSYAIAIIAMLSAVVGAFVYLRIIVSMWLEETESAPAPRIPFASGLVIVAAVVFTVFVGVFPGWLLDATDLVTAIYGG